MGGCVTKAQAITPTQYLDLVYPQSGTLYDLLPDALRQPTYPTSSKPLDVPHVDGIIGSVTQTSSKYSSNQKSISNSTLNSPLNPSSNLGKTSEVNSIQSTMTDKASKGKNKCKAKEKYDTP